MIRGGFSYKSRQELKSAKIEDVKAYYRAWRKYEYENHLPFRYYRLKRAISPLFRFGVSIERLLSGRKLEILGDYRTKQQKKRPHIYAVSHVGRYDVESGVEAIRDHAYFFYGDKEEAYRDFNGFLIELNGAVTLDTGWYTDFDGEIRFDERCIEDRQIALERAIEFLNLGRNLFLCPEGAWNLTPNLLIQRLYPGFVEMLARSDADIIPVVIERFGRRYVTIVGMNIDFRSMEYKSLDEPYMQDVFEQSNGLQPETIVVKGVDGAARNKSDRLIDFSLDRREIIRYLRDAMATLKWIILEREPASRRGMIPSGFEKMYIDDIMSESEPYYTADVIRHTRYRDKEHPSPDEVFGRIRTLSRWKDLPRSG